MVRYFVWKQSLLLYFLKNSSSLFKISHSFTKTGEDSDVIQAALVRYKMLVFPDAQVGGADSKYPQITGLNVHIIQPYKAMDFKMDESCKI